MEYLQHGIDHIRIKYPHAGICVCGDFNDLKASWLSRSLSLKQVVTRPTRENKILDLVFTSIPEHYKIPRTLAPLGKSDHQVVLWEPCSHVAQQIKKTITYRPKSERQVLLFKQVLQSKNWTRLYRMDNSNNMAKHFLTEIKALYDEFFPEKTAIIKPKAKPWMTTELERLIDSRDLIYELEGTSRQWKNLRNFIVKKTKEAKRDYGKECIDKILISDPRKFHQTIQSMTGKKTNESEIKNEDGDAITTDEINEHFSKVCRTYPGLESLPDLPPLSEIPTVEVTHVTEALQKLNPTKAAFHGEIPPSLAKMCAEEIAAPLAAIFNQSLIEGQFPECFKTAHITPIPKKKQPASINELRPISNTSLFSKLLEGFIYKKLFEEIQQKLDPQQYGFRPGCSTNHYLVQLLDEVLSHLENNEAFVDTIIADFVKAFDLLDHKTTLQEAAKMGASQHSLRMLAGFLSGRSQKVILKNVISEVKAITCGAPQGTKLGPLVFLIVINRLLQDIKNKYKFADDLSINVLRKLSDPTGEDPLVSTIETLTSDAEDVKLTLSTEKSSIIRFCFLKREVPCIQSLGLSTVNSVKILGIHIDSDLSWKTQVNNIIKKGGLLLQLFAVVRRFSQDRKVLLTVYKTHIRPNLEYACPVWHAALSQDQTDKLEALQKRVCKIIFGSQYKDYESSLETLRLQTLSSRRHCLLMDFGKKCLATPLHRSILPDFMDKVATRSRPNTRLKSKLSEVEQLQTPPCRTNRYEKSFVPYFVRNFNEDKLREIDC